MNFLARVLGGGSVQDANENNLVAENERLRRHLQTAPARALRKAKRKLLRTHEASDAKHPSFSERLQTKFFTHKWHRGPERPSGDPTADSIDGKQRFTRERARCVWSFLQCVKDKVIQLLTSQRRVDHLLSTCIADDTNTRLRPSSEERSMVYTIMNTVQFVYVRFDDGNWEGLHIPTPLRCLPSGKASSIYQSFTCWLVASASGVGSIWRLLGCSSTLVETVKWRTLILMGDALRANDAAWKTETRIRAKNSAKGNLGIRLKCNNHQMSLVRKPAILSIERFWSTVVRLGHLLETYSFRRNLASALVSLLHKDGEFVRNFTGFRSTFCFLISLLLSSSLLPCLPRHFHVFPVVNLLFL